jgi:SHS2 domain-containing protein
MTPYEYLDDVAIADIAFTAWGNSIEEVFRSAADAVMNVMVEDLDTISPLERRAIARTEDEIEMLLFNFLQDFIYYKDSEVLLLRVEELSIRRTERGFDLKAILAGERIDADRHSFRVDVKAVTLHLFEIKEEARGFRANVILDV